MAKEEFKNIGRLRNSRMLCSMLDENVEQEEEAGSEYIELAEQAEKEGHKALAEFSRFLSENKKDNNRTLRWWRSRLCR